MNRVRIKYMGFLVVTFETSWDEFCINEVIKNTLRENKDWKDDVKMFVEFIYAFYNRTVNLTKGEPDITIDILNQEVIYKDVRLKYEQL